MRLEEGAAWWGRKNAHDAGQMHYTTRHQAHNALKSSGKRRDARKEASQGDSHLEEGRGGRVDADAVHRAICSLERHVVGDEVEVPRVHSDAVRLEDRLRGARGGDAVPCCARNHALETFWVSYEIDTGRQKRERKGVASAAAVRDTAGTEHIGYGFRMDGRLHRKEPCTAPKRRVRYGISRSSCCVPMRGPSP